MLQALHCLFTAAFLVEYIWDTTIALHHFRKSLSITGQHWNRLANVHEREVSRAIEENVLSGAEKTILRLRKHSGQEGSKGELKPAHSSI